MRFPSILAFASCLVCAGGTAYGTPVPRTGDYLAARFAAEHHDLAKAADMFGRSLAADPSNPQLLASTFFFSAAAGRIDTSAKLAARLIDASKDERAAHLTLGVVALNRRDYRLARAEVAKSDSDKPASLTVLLLDAWAAAGAGDKNAVAEDIKAVRKTDGAEVLADFNEALLAEFLGDSAKAAQLYDKTLHEAGPTPRSADALGRLLERSGKIKEADDLYTHLKGIGAFRPLAEAGLARIALEKVPAPMVNTPQEGAAEALFGIAASLDDDVNADVSILYLRLVLYLRPDFDLAKFLLADRFEALERYDDAIAIYDAIGRESLYAREAAIQRADCKARQGDDETALKEMRMLTETYPSNVEVWTAYGDLLRDAKKNGEAVAAYGRALALSGEPSKKDWSLFFARAVSEQEGGSWDAAEADLRKALALNPDQPQVLNFLGYSWVDQHRNLDQATTMLEKAVKLAPENGYIVDSMGWAYYRLGRYGDAERTLEKAVEMVPGDPTINDHLGDAYWKVGRKLEAGFQWNHALAFGAADKEKAEIDRKLKDGLDGDK